MRENAQASQNKRVEASISPLFLAHSSSRYCIKYTISGERFFVGLSVSPLKSLHVLSIC